MQNLIKKVTETDQFDDSVTLEYNERIKSRLRVTLNSGVDAGIILPRGTSLQDGDILQAEDGFTVLVKAAKEKVSTVETNDAHLLARACYHLGNRHVSLQIEKNWLRYRHDHVLDQMLESFGLKIVVKDETFEPEPGAYHSHHAHNHEH